MPYILVILFVCISHTAFSNEIQFEEVSDIEAFEQIIAEKQKPVMLYFHASWCAPCRRMESTTLQNRRVVRFLNQHFLNFSVDIDGEFGKALKKNYSSSGVPAFLFLDVNSEILKVSVGFKNRATFLDVAQKALSSTVTLDELRVKHHEGTSSAVETILLAEFLNNLGDPKQFEVADAYLETLELSDLLKEKNWAFFIEFNQHINSPAFKIVVDELEQFFRTFGRQEVEVSLTKVVVRDILKTIREKDYELLTRIVNYLKKFSADSDALTNNENRLRLYANVNFYKKNEDWDAFAAHAVPFVEDHSFRLLNIHLNLLKRGNVPEDVMEYQSDLTIRMSGDIIQYANYIRLHVEDENVLKTAQNWIEKLFDLYSEIEVIDLIPNCEMLELHYNFTLKTDGTNAAGQLLETYQDAIEKHECTF